MSKQHKQDAPATDPATANGGATDLPEHIDVDLGGFNSNQQIEVETILNADFDRIIAAKQANEQFIDDDGKRVRSGQVNRALIYVALKDDYPNITLEEAGAVPLKNLTREKSDDDEAEIDTTD